LAVDRQATVTASAALAGDPHGGAGAVFVQSNDISGDAILAYARFAAGALTPAGRYPTLGRGGTEPGAPTDPLSSQGSLTVDRSHRLLYAVKPEATPSPCSPFGAPACISCR